MYRLSLSLMALYLSLAPVFWFPFIDTDQFLLSKKLIFAALVLATGLSILKSNAFVVPRSNLTGPLMWAVILVCLIPCYFISEADESFDHAFNYLEIFVFVVVALHLYDSAGQNKQLFFKFLLIPCLVISFLSAVHILDSLFTVFNLSSLSPIDVPFYSTGFSSSRVTWGYICSFLPLSVIAVYGLRLSDNWRTISILTMFGLMTYSTILTGGRSGYLSCILTVYVYFLTLNRPAFLFTIPLQLACAVLFLSSDEFLQTARLTALFDPTQTMDDLSTGRLVRMADGLDRFAEAPLIGHGLKMDGVGEIQSAHNLWLVLANQGGLFAMVPSLIFVGAIMLGPAWSGQRAEKQSRQNLRLFYLGCFFVAFLGTLFEPQRVIGTFQQNAAFWIMAAISLAVWSPIYRVSLRS